MKSWKIFTTETNFNFGKYEGNTLNQVAQIDAPYLLWCVQKIEKFLISEEDLIVFSNKYEKIFTTFCSPTNEEFERSTNYYTVTNDDVNLLKKKWQDYEDYIEMMDNVDYDYYQDYSVGNNPYYNDNLDMDQQDPEFWDSF